MANGTYDTADYLTNITGVNSLYDLGTFAADASAGLFFGVILVSFFFIIVWNTHSRGIDQAMVAASFPCLIISTLLVYLNWVSILFPITFLTLLAITLVIKVMSAARG